MGSLQLTQFYPLKKGEFYGHGIQSVKTDLFLMLVLIVSGGEPIDIHLGLFRLE